MIRHGTDKALRGCAFATPRLRLARSPPARWRLSQSFKFNSKLNLNSFDQVLLLLVQSSKFVFDRICMPCSTLDVLILPQSTPCGTATVT
eukprot:3685791-Rhodomonas_salina.1